MKKLLIIMVIIGQFNLISCSKDNTSPETTLPAEKLLNIAYGSNSQQKFDLYLPAKRSSTKTKVIVLVHGGGWTEGDKSDMDFLIPYIQEKHPDHAIVNLNYTLANANTPAFPNQILNIGQALDMLEEEKDTYQILPNFALVGASAGAHLSLIYDYVYDENNRIKLIADIVGPTDFTDPFYTENPGFDALLALLVDESAYPPQTDFRKVLSPALLVGNNSSPTLLFYGREDPLVPLTNGEALNNALNNAQIDHHFSVYEGGHGNWKPQDIENMLAQISDYIDTYLEVRN